jgi:hypothetical protein
MEEAGRLTATAVGSKRGKHFFQRPTLNAERPSIHPSFHPPNAKQGPRLLPEPWQLPQRVFTWALDVERWALDVEPPPGAVPLLHRVRVNQILVPEI